MFCSPFRYSCLFPCCSYNESHTEGQTYREVGLTYKVLAQEISKLPKISLFGNFCPLVDPAAVPSTGSGGGGGLHEQEHESEPQKHQAYMLINP